MKRYALKFLKNEDGAVSVDWVVLTAAVVGMAVGAINVIGDSTNLLSENVASRVEATDVGTSSPTPTPSP